ncbi:MULTISPECIES: (4Fe-4S)-binding protein [Listeria]|uniref:(4Fe-4S)-binding protein n=1 Tax=Listeria TaxID=1637 RepID=UPI000B58F9D4|nr:MULTISPECIES: (4Fe-4S)-binding protein [Listeria]
MNEQELLEKGYRKYDGEKVDVFFNTSICAHSGNCVRGNGELFNLDRKPWILPDNVAPEEVVRVIDTCPSGALKYIVHTTENEK